MAEIYYNPHPLIMLKLTLYSMLHHSFSFFMTDIFSGANHILRNSGITGPPSTLLQYTYDWLFGHAENCILTVLGLVPLVG